VISSVSITTVQSDCALDVAVASPAGYNKIKVRDTQTTLRLNYVCPSGEGDDSLMISSVSGFEVAFSSCTAVP
jgi:hypothetical protein